MNTPSFLKISVCSVLLMTSLHAFSAPKSELWPLWNKSNESNIATINHQKWQDILSQGLVVSGEQNLFNYAGMTKKDKAQLQDYISQMAALDPRQFNKKEQFAYWVNLYNALTVQRILNAYPVASITKLGGFFSFGPWDETAVSIKGEKLTLNDIEHRILRPIWKDPRIHYAVNCASLGCPNLVVTAYNATNSHTLLEEAAKQFTQSQKGAQIKGETLTLSSLYDWYSIDFGKNTQEILRHIDTYRQGKKLEGWQGKINYDYDWALNKAK